MLLFATKMGVQQYFWFAVKMADTRDILLKYNSSNEMLNSKIKALMVLYAIWLKENITLPC